MFLFFPNYGPVRLDPPGVKTGEDLAYSGLQLHATYPANGGDFPPLAEDAFICARDGYGGTQLQTLLRNSFLSFGAAWGPGPSFC